MADRGAGRADAARHLSDPLAEDLLVLASQLSDLELMLQAPPASAAMQYDELAAATEVVAWICASVPVASGAGAGLSRALRHAQDALGRAVASADDPRVLRSVLATTRSRLADARRLLVVAAASVLP